MENDCQAISSQEAKSNLFSYSSAFFNSLSIVSDVRSTVVPEGNPTTRNRSAMTKSKKTKVPRLKPVHFLRDCEKRHKIGGSIKFWQIHKTAYFLRSHESMSLFPKDAASASWEIVFLQPW
jgi:hypothetical protein